MWFRRIQEIYEVEPPNTTISKHWNKPAQFGETSFSGVTFGPAAPKRKLDDYDGEDGDFTRFKRIRMISQRKRVKIPNVFNNSASPRSFGDLKCGKVKQNPLLTSLANGNSSVTNTKPEENIFPADCKGWLNFNALAVSRVTSNEEYQQRSHSLAGSIWESSTEGSNRESYQPLRNTEIPDEVEQCMETYIFRGTSLPDSLRSATRKLNIQGRAPGIHLTAQGAKEAREMRSHRACWRCQLQRERAWLFKS
jgi:hypothetical protein